VNNHAEADAYGGDVCDELGPRIYSPPDGVTSILLARYEPPSYDGTVPLAFADCWSSAPITTLRTLGLEDHPFAVA
jgi:hypothetical protein